MSLLPAISNAQKDGLTSRQLVKAARDRANAELAVFNHCLQTVVLSETDRFDSEALADVSRAALDEEMALLDYGLNRAGQSAVKAAIVARHVERLVTINDRRIRERFDTGLLEAQMHGDAASTRQSLRAELNALNGRGNL